MRILKYSDDYAIRPEFINRLVHETNEPVFLMLDEHTGIVLLSLEAYESLQFRSDVYLKLKEAELNASEIRKTYTSNEVFSELKKAIESPCAGSVHRLIP